MLVNKNTIIFITLVNFYVVCSGITRNGYSEYRYHYQLQGWLRVHTEPTDWHSARLQCHMEGAFLVSTWSRDFFEVMTHLLFDYQIPAMFSGEYSSFADGVFVYKEGKPAISLNLLDVVVMNRCEVFTVSNPAVQFHSCKDKLPYACYTPIPKPKTEASPEVKPDPTPDLGNALSMISKDKCGTLGYEFSEVTGHCYKFHAHSAKTWYDAKAACEEEGAYLAVVNSYEEAQVLVKLYAKYPREEIYNAEYPDTAAIGFLYNESSARWETVNGESLDVGGYSLWEYPKPDITYLPQAAFGFIRRDGLLMGYVTNIYRYNTSITSVIRSNYPFICEKRKSDGEPKPELTASNPRQYYYNQLQYYLKVRLRETKLKTVPEQELEQSTKSNTDPASATVASACDESLGYASTLVRGSDGLVSKQCFRIHELALKSMYNAKNVCERDGDVIAFIDKKNLRDFKFQLQLLFKYQPKSIENFPSLAIKPTASTEHQYSGDETEYTDMDEFYRNTSKLVYVFIDGHERPYINGLRDFKLFICEKKGTETIPQSDLNTTWKNSYEPGLKITSKPVSIPELEYDKVFKFASTPETDIENETTVTPDTITTRESLYQKPDFKITSKPVSIPELEYDEVFKFASTPETDIVTETTLEHESMTGFELGEGFEPVTSITAEFDIVTETSLKPKVTYDKLDTPPTYPPPDQFKVYCVDEHAQFKLTSCFKFHADTYNTCNEEDIAMSVCSNEDAFLAYAVTSEQANALGANSQIIEILAK